MVHLDARQAGVVARLFLAEESVGAEPDAATAPEESSPGAGRRIGGYRVLRELGRGGMGTVYEAEQARPRRTVALKVLETGTASRQSLRRFELESSSLARLRHPGIAEVYEAGFDGAPPAAAAYIAMELVPAARDIARFVRAEALDPAACARLFAEVCDAVHHGHQRGVIHRDLKPANILVGADGRPKVIDFGVAHAVDDEVTLVTAHTGAGQLVGTLPYMSPEQCAAGETVVDVRCDVYALGAVLYEALCGRRPHDVSSAALPRAIRTICEADPLRPAAARPGLPTDLEAIVLGAIARDPNARYQSAGDLAADLRRFARGEPVARAAPGRLRRARSFVRRHRTLVAGAAVAASLLVALVGVLAWAVVTQRSLLQEARRARDGARDVETLAIGFLTELAEELGTSAVRGPMWAALHERLVAEVAQHPEDARARLNLARVASGLGDVELDEGRVDEADRLFRAALAVREAAADAAPDDGDRRRELSINLVRVGDVAKERRDLAEAENWYEKARAIDETLVARFPHVARYADDLSWSYDRLADLARRAGRHDEASALLVRRHELIERLRADEPDNLTRVAGAGASHLALGALALERPGGDAALVARHLEAAHALADRLVAAEPDNRRHLAMFGSVLVQRAIAARERGAVAEARRFANEAIGVRERLWRSDPNVPDYRDRLASALARSATIEMNAGALETARARTARAVELRRPLVADDPEAHRVHFIQTLELHYWRCAGVGRADEVEATRCEIVVHRRALAAAPDAGTGERARLAVWLARSPDGPDHEEALALAERVAAETDPSDMWAEYALALARHACGDHAAARRWLVEAEERADPRDHTFAGRIAELRASLEAAGAMP